MFSKLVFTISLLAMSQEAWANAAETFECALPNHTKSFQLDLKAYKDSEYQYVAVDVIEYPGRTKLFYRIQDERVVKGVREILLYNPEIYFQAEQTLILRVGPKKTTLEVFWIQGPTGFGVGGTSGSQLYRCQ